MTREELQKCHGHLVQVTLDGKDADAILLLNLSPNNEPLLAWPLPEDGTWEDTFTLPLTENDIAAFRPSGKTCIISTVSLSTEGGKHRL